MSAPWSSLRQRPIRGEQAVERTLLVGITAFRWAAWVWMAVVFAVDTQGRQGVEDLVARPGAGWVLVLVALGYTVWATGALVWGARRLDRAAALAVDVAIAASLLGLDPWIYESAHAQRLGSNWAIATVLTAGVLFAGRGGLVVGLLLGAARGIGQLRWEAPLSGDDLLGLASAAVIYSLGGAAAGFFAIRLREAEREVAAGQAREEVARTLHDGVLQTLAVIQRRSDDDALVALARDQERELRTFLARPVNPGLARPVNPGLARPVNPGLARPVNPGPSGRSRSTIADGPEPHDDLVGTLRAAADRVTRMHDTRADVVTVGPIRGVAPELARALVGAAGEAMTNAAKHGDADRIVVFAEIDDDGALFCSVKDDGCGFDTAAVPEGRGLRSSVRGRVTEVGGDVEVASRPGHGTEVRLRFGSTQAASRHASTASTRRRRWPGSSTARRSGSAGWGP